MTHPYPSGQPAIPINCGELLFVALSHTLDYIDEHGEFPPGMSQNMRQVLSRYDRDRNAVMQMRGIPVQAVQRYTAVAAEKLAEWIDKQAARHEAAEADFTKWTEELKSDG